MDSFQVIIHNYVYINGAYICEHEIIYILCLLSQFDIRVYILPIVHVIGYRYYFVNLILKFELKVP